MSNRPCPCCSEQRILIAAVETLLANGIIMKKCPSCGREFDTIEDENGMPMHQYDVPWSDKRGPLERESLGIDLDKIDISREMEILEKYQDKKNAKLLDVLAERYYRQMLDDLDIDN